MPKRNVHWQRASKEDPTGTEIVTTTIGRVIFNEILHSVTPGSTTTYRR